MARAAGTSSRFLRWFLGQVGFQSIVVIAIVWFGFLLVEDVFVRWDLTEDNRFTISDASHRMAADLEDPLTIRVYMSANVPPRYQPLQRQVLDVLTEYEAASGGKIKVERFDPDESQTAQNEAKNYSIQPVQLPVYEATSVQVLQVYGGIVLVYRDRNSEVINFADRYLQGYEGLAALEYEISSKIWQLANAKPKIGLTGNLTVQMGGGPMGPRGGQQQPIFQGLRRILGEAFEIENVDLNQAAPDAAKLPLLLVVRPKEFNDVQAFRLDQYLMKGGRVILFVSQGDAQQTRWSPNFSWIPFKTGLDAWLAHHGLRVPEEFVLHYRNANPIPVDVDLGGGLRGQMNIENWFWPIVFAEESIDKNNPAVQTLKRVAMFWPHPVDLLHDRLAKGVTSSVLIRSHEQESWRWRNVAKMDMRLVDRRADLPQKSDIQSSGLVVALEGTFDSFFADATRIPPSLKEEVEDKEDAEGKDDEKKKERKTKDPDVLKSSTKAGHLIVVGNSIFISDMILGGGQGGKVSQAAREATLLAFNLIDWLARSEDLIALRTKSFSNRQIVDEDFDEDLDEINEKAEKGDITQEKYREMIDDARERQKTRRKRWRWKNILWPAGLILAAAALVWILRAARRARPARVPKSVPPKSAEGKE